MSEHKDLSSCKNLIFFSQLILTVLNPYQFLKIQFSLINNPFFDVHLAKNYTLFFNLGLIHLIN